LAGIPPLAGFYAKLLIFFCLNEINYYLLLLYSLVFSVLTCVYYLRLIRFILFNINFKDFIYNYKTIPFVISFLIMLFFFINVLMLFLQESIFIYISTFVFKLIILLNFYG